MKIWHDQLKTFFSNKMLCFSESKDKAESSSADSPISTETSETPLPDPTPVRPRKSTRPNVAVIKMYDKELGENTAHQHKRQKKSPAKKKQSSLSVQVRTKIRGINKVMKRPDVQYFLMDLGVTVL